MAPKITKTVSNNQGGSSRNRWYYFALGIVAGVGIPAIFGAVQAAFFNPRLSELDRGFEYASCTAKAQNVALECGSTQEEFERRKQQR